MSTPYFPLFPLDVFLLPGEFFQLHIFEPRYKQLVKDAMQGDGKFGIPFFHITNGRNLGSVVEIIDVFNENELGECDIAIRCTDLLIVKEYTQRISDDTLYPGGVITVWNSDWNTSAPSYILDTFKTHIERHRSNDRSRVTNTQVGLIDVFASLNPNAQDKLKYVLCKTNEAREQYVYGYLQYFDLISEQESRVYQNLYLN